MKNKKTMPMMPEVQSRLTELRQRAVEMASESGLFQVDDRIQELLEPQLRTAAWQLHGNAEVPPEILEHREAELRQRGDEAARRAAVFFEAIRNAAPVISPARPLFGWRGSLLVGLTATVAGLLSPEISLRGYAVLALSAVIGILALPLVPAVARFAISTIRDSIACTRDLGSAALYYQGCRKMRRSACAAADHRDQVDRWVAVQMSHLLAEYAYHKSLAAAARLAL